MHASQHSLRTVLLATLCATLLLAPVATAGSAGSSSQDVSMTLSEVSAAQGETVTVTVDAEGENVAGYQANVTFDPSVVTVVNVSGADMSKPVVNVNNDEGWVFFTQSQAEGTSSPTVAKVTFKVVGSPSQSTDLQFVQSDTKVNDESGSHLSLALDGGKVSVSGDASVDGQANNDGDGESADSNGVDDSDGGDASNADASDPASGSSDDGVGGTGVSTPLLAAGAVTLLGAGALLGRYAS